MRPQVPFFAPDVGLCSMRCMIPRLFMAVVLAFPVLGVGCSAPQEPEEPALCRIRRQTEEREVRPVTPEEWLQFLVTARVGERATQSCSGMAIRLPEPSEHCRAELSEERAEPRPLALSEESVIDRRLSTQARLIWVITHELPGGDGLGPVALVERERTEDESRLAVRAIGVLRARTEHVHLRLEEMGRREVLIAEGDVCEDPSAPATCQRAATFMLRRGSSFVQAELHYLPRGYSSRSERDSGGSGYHRRRCLGRASMVYAREQEAELDGEWRREFSLASSYEISRGAIIVHEQVSAVDENTATPEVPPRPFRTSEAQQRWVPYGNATLITRTESIWDRFLTEDGAMEVPQSDEDDEGDEAD